MNSGLGGLLGDWTEVWRLDARGRLALSLAGWTGGRADWGECLGG